MARFGLRDAWAPGDLGWDMGRPDRGDRGRARRGPSSPVGIAGRLRCDGDPASAGAAGVPRRACASPWCSGSPCFGGGALPGPGAPTPTTPPRVRTPHPRALHEVEQPVDRDPGPLRLRVEGRVEGRHHTGEPAMVEHQAERCGGHRQKRACRCRGEIGVHKGRTAPPGPQVRPRGQALARWPGVSGTLAARCGAPWRGPTATTTACSPHPPGASA